MPREETSRRERSALADQLVAAGQLGLGCSNYRAGNKRRGRMPLLTDGRVAHRHIKQKLGVSRSEIPARVLRDAPESRST